MVFIVKFKAKLGIYSEKTRFSSFFYADIVKKSLIFTFGFAWRDFYSIANNRTETGLYCSIREVFIHFILRRESVVGLR